MLANSEKAENIGQETLTDEVYKRPLMALRGITLFPGMVLTFDVERARSLASLNAAWNQKKREILLVTQRDVMVDDPSQEDLFQVGTVAVLRQYARMPDGSTSVMVEGRSRAELLSMDDSGEYTVGEYRLLEIPDPEEPSARTEALIRQAVHMFESYAEMTGAVSPNGVALLTVKRSPGFVADHIMQELLVHYQQKQTILETLDPHSRLRAVIKILRHELEVVELQRDIGQKMREEMSRSHRDSFLREQLRIIRSELGETSSDNDEDEYREKIRALHLDPAVESKLLKEVDRLSRQSFGSAEASVLRSYLDTCLELPWNERTNERIDLDKARKILERDHFGLEKVKERIIEYLSVKKLAPHINAPILCFVGPPGVGKTSIAISIAEATNRKLARMSLGGIHDEAEIRGHRKTYVGSMPGRIMYAINQAHTKNPLLLLDEIDKLGNDFRGDPASALLEALDPEQNSTFRDHYLEVPFDLSEAMFITTANTTATIPPALLDRMEVIQLSSYTDEEKLQIASKYLIPKQRKKHGMNGNQLRITREAVRELISGYTRESGVRNLEREIAAVCRKAAAKIASGECSSLRVNAAAVQELLGSRKFKPESIAAEGAVGIVNGLAWTAYGGEVLEVEATVLEGSGRLELTGNLGDVMKESARAAISYIRSRARILGIDPEFYRNRDIHLHFPEGAVPKDGPSAGISITVAVISALTEIPVRAGLAMTGEVTLSGRVLAIGGLKEKTMAALRSGLHTVIIPAENEHDLDEIDQTVRRALHFILASNIDGILTSALQINELPIRKNAGEPQADEPASAGDVS